MEMEEIMKKIASVLIAVLLVLTFLPKQQEVSAASFTDLTSTHRFYQDIIYLLDKGVINDSSRFGVEDYVTREEVAVMVSKAINLSGVQTTTPFKDVPKSLASSGYINSAANKGIISGFLDDTFRPKEVVTRGQMAIFLSRAFNLTAEKEVKFKDMSPKVSSYKHVRQILAVNITSGFPDNSFRPNEKLKRGQIAAFLARSMRIGNPPPVSSTMVSIVSKDLAEEIVGIKNTGSQAVNLSGWTLVSVEANQTFKFPNFTLTPGSIVYVTSGSNANSGSNYLKWATANIWLNSGDAAKLLNAQGTVVSEFE